MSCWLLKYKKKKTAKFSISLNSAIIFLNTNIFCDNNYYFGLTICLSCIFQLLLNWWCSTIDSFHCLVWPLGHLHKIQVHSRRRTKGITQRCLWFSPVFLFSSFLLFIYIVLLPFFDFYTIHIITAWSSNFFFLLSYIICIWLVSVGCLGGEGSDMHVMLNDHALIAQCTCSDVENLVLLRVHESPTSARQALALSRRAEDIPEAGKRA